MVQEAGREVQRISLLDSLRGEWLKLPLGIMQDVGPAVQTMGGLLAITNRETYVPIGDIATRARLPASTVKKHLVTLDAKGWIDHQGRQQTRRGFLRRTATIRITRRATEAMEPYGFLPWWACCTIHKVGRLPWCCKAVLSIFMARVCSTWAGLKEVCEDDENVFLANLEGERFRFGLDYLADQTGLSRDSVVSAKQSLARVGIIKWIGDHPRRGHDTDTHILFPNGCFEVVVTPASAGRCWLDFARGSKSGL